MNQHFLEKLFSPTSIAVIGASDRPNSVGMKVFKNLLQGQFKGKLSAINPKHHQVQGEPCFSSVKKIKEPVDLAVITTPARTVPDLIMECGEKNIHSVIVLSAGFSEIGKDGKLLEEAMLKAAKNQGIRIVGPNCLGIMRPQINMNATFDNNFPLQGSLALVSQSGALTVGILDWSMNRKIGFSAIVSMGNNADVDFGDVLDYLAFDTATKSILLYIEGIRNARHFMSALRAAARMKPVIALKSGKNSQGSRAALSHTGALIGSDDVFDVALRRAGAVRVMKIEDLFSTSEILSSPKQVKGNRLVIITNGGGAGVIAADRASELNVELSALSDPMRLALNKVLPSQWSRQNPIDIIGDATPDRYHETLNICKNDENVDGILAMLVPTSMSQPFKVAKQIVQDSKQTEKIILTSWIGEKQVKSSWKLFNKNNVPSFDTPEKAVEAFSYLADFYMNQKLLMQVPPPFSQQSKPDIEKVRLVIENVLASGRRLLTTYESKKILKLFDIPVTETIEVDTAMKAIEAAKSVGFPVVMKINSLEITHKSEVGGVCLFIRTEQEVRDAFEQMMERVNAKFPNTKVLGVTIEPQYPNKYDREVMIGVMRDIVFGPVISIGAGGTIVEIIKDRALGLPPLNTFMVRRLMSKTRIFKLGGKLRQISETQMKNIVNIILRVSEMVCEIPYIQEMDINPFIINETGMMAVDARFIVAPLPSPFIPYSHLAIHPYPQFLVSTHPLANTKNIIIRPICPEDAELEQEFIHALSPQAKYFRFMGTLRELTPWMLVRFTQIDYDCEMALVAIYEQNTKQKIVGISRYIIDPNQETAEFSIVVADEWQRQGIGSLLLNTLSQIAKTKNIKALVGMVLANNVHMLKLMEHLGFEISTSDDPNIQKVTKKIE